jgi:hypothetical protein
MSLWKVDDEATLELMTGYYRRLARGAGRAEALRQAQLGMLAQPGRSAPYFWAAFPESGNPSALDGSLRAPELTRTRACACDLVGDRSTRPRSALFARALLRWQGRVGEAHAEKKGVVATLDDLALRNDGDSCRAWTAETIAR